MSQTVPIACGENGFWGYDVAVRVFLKYLIEVATVRAEANTPWLSQAVSDWRVNALVGASFQLTLGEDWSDEQRAFFITLAEQACAELARKGSISAGEIADWDFPDEEGMGTRAAYEVGTGPVVELGRAMIALVRGDLPQTTQRHGLVVRYTGGPHNRRNGPFMGRTLVISPDWRTGVPRRLTIFTRHFTKFVSSFFVCID